MAIYHPGQDVAFAERQISLQSFIVQIKGVNALSNNELAWRRTKGAATLEEACTRLVLTQIHNFTSRTLMTVPWRVAQKIWKRIHPMSFETWRMFVQVFGHEEQLADASIVLNDNFSLPQGMEKGTAWLTILNLQINSTTFEGLVNLSSVPSLAVVTLNGETTRTAEANRVVDDRLLRTWSRSAKEAGAFANLRILSFHNCHSLTMQCLEFLGSIDALAWIFFHKCQRMSSKGSHSAASQVQFQKEWSSIDLQQLRCQNDNSESTLKLCKLPDLEHYAWMDWYGEEIRRLAKQTSMKGRGPHPSNISPGNKPMLSFFAGRQPLILDYPLVFRRIEEKPRTMHDIGHLASPKRPAEQLATKKSSKRQMKGGKIQDTDFSQFYQ